jgi:hypothetical protein
MVLSRFDPQRQDPLREVLRTARSIGRFHVMILQRSELAAAQEAFAVKFADIACRHHVLWGTVPFLERPISRQARLLRLQQELLNFIIRQRQQFLITSLREEQMAHLLAEAAAPLRSAATTILELQGTPCSAPKTALESLVAQAPNPDWNDAIQTISQARSGAKLAPGIANTVCWQLLDLADWLRQKAIHLNATP